MSKPLAVLADANVLVKDVVSYVFFDLNKVGAVDLRWTPAIEVEYIRHRARLRAQAQGRVSSLEDLLWAERRLIPIKTYLVPHHLPPGWDVHGHHLTELRRKAVFTTLLELPDPDDVHVALAAAGWAHASGHHVLLCTDNLKDLPAELLEPFGVTPLHPEDVLQLAYQVNPNRVAASLKKTAADFKNPAFSLMDMLASVRSLQQFDNSQLADQLATRWGLMRR